MGGKSGNKGPRRPDGGDAASQGREARLKAALKANIARRKAQARARADGADDRTDPDPEADGQQQDG
jgi:hypothetical protein